MHRRIRGLLSPGSAVARPQTGALPELRQVVRLGLEHLLEHVAGLRMVRDQGVVQESLEGEIPVSRQPGLDDHLLVDDVWVHEGRDGWRQVSESHAGGPKARDRAVGLDDGACGEVPDLAVVRQVDDVDGVLAGHHRGDDVGDLLPRTLEVDGLLAVYHAADPTSRFGQFLAPHVYRRHPEVEPLPLALVGEVAGQELVEVPITRRRQIPVDPAELRPEAPGVYERVGVAACFLQRDLACFAVGDPAERLPRHVLTADGYPGDPDKVVDPGYLDVQRLLGRAEHSGEHGEGAEELVAEPDAAHLRRLAHRPGEGRHRSLDRLLGRADQDLVHAHPLGLRHRVGDGAGYVLRLQPLQAHEAAEALAGLLVGYVVRELRLDGPRLDHRHPDVVFQELLAQALGDGVYGELGAGVDPARVAGHLPPGEATDVDDVPGTLPFHHFQGGVCGVEDAEHVHLEHLAPLFREALPDRREEHDARVVDEDVYLAELLFGFLDQAVRLALVGDVAPGREHPAAAALYPTFEVGEPILPPRRDNHRGAFRGEGLGRSLADTARCARHDCHLAVQLRHIKVLSVLRNHYELILPLCRLRVPVGRGGELEVGERPVGVVEGAYGARDHEQGYEEEQSAHDADHDGRRRLVGGEERHGRAQQDHPQDDHDHDHRYPKAQHDAELHQPGEQAPADVAPEEPEAASDGVHDPPAAHDQLSQGELVDDGEGQEDQDEHGEDEEHAEDDGQDPQPRRFRGGEDAESPEHRREEDQEPQAQRHEEEEYLQPQHAPEVPGSRPPGEAEASLLAPVQRGDALGEGAVGDYRQHYEDERQNHDQRTDDDEQQDEVLGDPTKRSGDRPEGEALLAAQVRRDVDRTPEPPAHEESEEPQKLVAPGDPEGL